MSGMVLIAHHFGRSCTIGQSTGLNIAWELEHGAPAKILIAGKP